MPSTFHYRALLLVFFLTPLMAFAQLGISAGVGIADVGFKKYGQSVYLGYENNSLIHEKPLLGYQLGVFMPLALGQKWQIQPALHYALKGINYSKHFLYDDIIYRIKLDYLQAPILLKYQISASDRGCTALYLGPYLAWKLRAVHHARVEGVETRVAVANVKASDFGTVVGGMVNRELATGQLVFDLRMSYSLTNMMDPVAGYLPEYGKTPKAYARNITMIISVGYLFEKTWNQKTKS